MTGCCGAAAATLESIDAGFPTTAGVLALVNLEAQIDGYQRQAAAGRLGVGGRAKLIELVAMRGHVLGCIADYERAEALSGHLTRDAPADGVAPSGGSQTCMLLAPVTCDDVDFVSVTWIELAAWI